MAPNNYKKDEGKAPLLSALQPFAPALYALARMMDDMKHKHRLAGSSDPFNQWAQLPGAKGRMEQAMERHLLPEEGTLWSVNEKDGGHLHATHGLFNLLGSLTLHLREQARVTTQDAMRDKVSAPMADMAHVLARASTELQVPAGADWRSGLPVQWWTDDRGTWRCSCGAGREASCTCPRTGENL